MISKEEIVAIAELARLKLKDGEAETLGKDISNILDYVGQINAFEADTTKEHKPDVRNVLREDVPRQEGDAMFEKRASILAALPRREGDHNVVRKIIQKDE